MKSGSESNYILSTHRRRETSRTDADHLAADVARDRAPCYRPTRLHQSSCTSCGIVGYASGLTSRTSKPFRS